MAQYKVLQDIEAEDKLVGPLTLRQFIYAGITAICLYICFIAVTKGVLFILPVFLLPAILTGFFAFPWGRDQPTEIWALAKIRFLLKPRRRVWNQSGVKELVTITVPKKIEVDYTNGLSQSEVKSRLKALADTIDSRGWAIKNVTNGLYVQPQAGQTSDRLVDSNTMPQEVPTIDTRNAADMLDERTNPVAQMFDRMIRQSDQAHRAKIMQTMAQAAESTTGAGSLQLPQPQAALASDANDWFLNPTPTTKAAALPRQDSQIRDQPAEEKKLAELLRKQNNSQAVSYAHLHTVLPMSEQRALARKAAELAGAKAKQHAQAPVTRQSNPAIMALASNNDLNVATIARQAEQQTQGMPDEVVISLH